jgi:hypothetical protein
MNDICCVKVLETIDDVMDLARVLLAVVHRTSSEKKTNKLLARSFRHPPQICHNITILHPGRHIADLFLSVQVENSIKGYDIGMIKLIPEDCFPREGLLTQVQ